MRQVVGFLKLINKARVVDFYNQTLSYGTVHGIKMPSLSEFLDVSLEEEASNAFDNETDRALEEHARRLFEERRKAIGGK